MAMGMQVEVAVATGPRQVRMLCLQLPAGARVRDALDACRRSPVFDGLDLAAMPAGIWGCRAQLEQALHDGDRLELYRPLLVDPKLARRERFVQQGARGTGLFAKRRPGAKSGY